MPPKRRPLPTQEAEEEYQAEKRQKKAERKAEKRKTQQEENEQIKAKKRAIELKSGSNSAKNQSDDSIMEIENVQEKIMVNIQTILFCKKIMTI